MRFPTDEEARILDNYFHRQDSSSILAYRDSKIFLTVGTPKKPPVKETGCETGFVENKKLIS